MSAPKLCKTTRRVYEHLVLHGQQTKVEIATWLGYKISTVDSQLYNLGKIGLVKAVSRVKRIAKYAAVDDKGDPVVPSSTMPPVLTESLKPERAKNPGRAKKIKASHIDAWYMRRQKISCLHRLVNCTHVAEADRDILHNVLQDYTGGLK